MNNTIKNIGILLSTISISLGFASCGYDEPKAHDKNVENPNVEISTPDNMFVNKAEALKVANYSVEIHEGHSHAPKGSQLKIGGVMWSKDFGGGYFHGNPYAESELPIKRYQKLSYTMGSNGKFRNDNPNSDNIFNILSSTPRKKYLGGVLNALIVKLYDVDSNRIDRILKADSMKDRVQVFYQVVNVKPSFEKYPLPKEYNKTDICYYWYYDRKPVFDEGRWWDDGDYIEDEAVGFRGVIQSLQPRTKFALRMSVTVLPKGMTKATEMVNSTSPTPEQAKHVVFQTDIPIRVVTESPNFWDEATAQFEAKVGRESTYSDYDEIDKISEKLEQKYYEELHEVFPDFSVERLKELIRERGRLNGESSNFYL